MAFKIAIDISKIDVGIAYLQAKQRYEIRQVRHIARFNLAFPITLLYDNEPVIGVQFTEIEAHWNTFHCNNYGYVFL